MEISPACALRTAIFTASLIALPVHAIELSCPAHITVRPATVNDVPPGWQASQRWTSLSVGGAFVTVGPPEKQIDLKPEIASHDGRRTFSWQFDPADRSERLWMSCVYGTLMLLSRPLPEGLSTCRTEEPFVDAKGTLVARMRCR
jgi:hypothetical protein